MILEFGYKSGTFSGKLGGAWKKGTRWSLVTPDGPARYPRTLTIRHKDNFDVHAILDRKNKAQTHWKLIDSPPDDHRTMGNSAKVKGVIDPLRKNLAKNRKEVTYTPVTMDPETSGISTNAELGKHYESLAKRSGYEVDTITEHPKVLLRPGMLSRK